MSPEEKAAIAGRAEAAGLKLSDFVRSRALEEGQVSSVPVDGPGRVSGAAAVAGPVPPRASVSPLAAAVPRRNVGPFGCPTPLCQKRGAKGEPCPKHGVPMTFKL